MVAISGTGWRLAPCLKALFDEADRRKPTRSHAADGTIGDLAHAARESDHNPADGWVCAGDVDDDGDSTPILGVDLLVAHLVASRDRRVKYLIRNGTIWKAYENRGLPPWTPQPYTGPSPHDHHAHISVWNTTEARNDLRPWWPAVKPAPPPDEEDDMAAFEFVHVSNGRTYVIGPNGEPGSLTADEIEAVKKAGWPIKNLPLSVWNKGT